MSPLPLFEKPKRARRELAEAPSEKPKRTPRQRAEPAENESARSAKKTPSKKTTSEAARAPRRAESSRAQPKSAAAVNTRLIRRLGHYAPYAVVAFVALVIVSTILRSMGSASQLGTTFTPEVQHWQRQILDWAGRYGVDPNLIATIMQIESCGSPGAASGAGAQGLFQVMPFNFSAGVTNQLDPEANAKAGLGVIKDCLRYANNDVSLALACYNGGPSLVNQPPSNWPGETQRYVAWGVGIYNDAKNHVQRSATLDSWLASGGVGLCQSAAVSLGLSTRAPNIPTLIPLPSTLPTFSGGGQIIPPTVTAIP